MDAVALAFDDTNDFDDRFVGIVGYPDRRAAVAAPDAPLDRAPGYPKKPSGAGLADLLPDLLGAWQ